MEYASNPFNFILTLFYPCHNKDNKLERIQKTALKIILGDMYVEYSAALKMSGLDTLYVRRTKRCLDFALECTKHLKNQRMFPKNVTHGHQVRSSERYKVNFARTSRYMQSTIPYCQRLLNKHINEQWRPYKHTNPIAVNDDLCLDLSQ